MAKYKVYISSTYRDLMDYREKVIGFFRKKSVEENFELVSMEGYVADDIVPSVECINDVENCDIYILILANRYGYIPVDKEKNPNEFSITELEYEAAKENAKQSYEPAPDCSKTFASINETQKLSSPLIVCKLDLSKSNLSAIPKEVYSFTNLQELNLGTTLIPQTEINQLQKALPKCKITYILAQTKEKNLGYLYFTNKGELDKQSLTLLKDIATQLKQNAQSKIRLEADYSNETERTKFTTYITRVKRALYNQGVNEKLQQVSEKLTKRQVQQQQQQNNAPNYTSDNMSVIGINFPDNEKNRPINMKLLVQLLNVLVSYH